MVSERNVGTAPRNRFALDVEVRLSSLKALLLIAYHFPNCGVVGSRVGNNMVVHPLHFVLLGGALRLIQELPCIVVVVRTSRACLRQFLKRGLRDPRPAWGKLLLWEDSFRGGEHTRFEGVSVSAAIGGVVRVLHRSPLRKS